MLRLALTITSMLAAQNAAAYAPELLLQKSMAKVPELESPSTHQYLNPFSEIKLGAEHSWGRSEGLISRDDQDRIRTRDEKEKANKLSLDVRPKGIAEALSYRKYEKVLSARTNLERRILQSKSSRAAYELLARAAQAKEEKALLAEWNTILERSQRLSAISARSEGDAKAVLKAASDVDKARNEMAEISSVIAGVNHSLSRRGLSVDELEIEQILTAEEVSERLAKITDFTSLTGEDAMAEVGVERARVKHAEDKNSKWIDGLKFTVAKSTDDIIRRRFVPFPDSTVPTPGSFLTQDESRKGTSYGIGLTINLPFLAATDLDEQRNRIKLARQEMDSQVGSDEATEHTAALREIVKEKVVAYLGSSEGKANISDSLLRNDPALAMEIQRASISKRLYRIKLLGEIRLLYVEFLFETGRLAEDADVNHLSKTNRKIGAGA